MAATMLTYAPHRHRLPLIRSGSQPHPAQPSRGHIVGDRAGPARLDLSQHGQRRTDLPRCAVPALKTVTIDKRLLQRMQPLRAGHTFDSGDSSALSGHRQDQAGVRPPAVEQHRAGAALPVITTLLCPHQVKVLSHRVQQGGAIVQLQVVRTSVDSQADPAHSGNAVGHISS